MEESFMGTCCFFPCQAGRLDVFFAGNIAASTRKEPMSDAVRDPSKKRNFPNGWPQESSVAVPQFNYCSSVRRWSAFKSTNLYLSQSNINIRIQSYDKISWGFLHLQESVRPGALCWSTTRCGLLWLQGMASCCKTRHQAPNVGCHGLANRETPEILCKSSTTTLPEPNVAPENCWLGDHFPLWGPACFQGKLLVLGRVYKSSVATTEPPTCRQSSEASGSVENTPGNLSESNGICAPDFDDKNSPEDISTKGHYCWLKSKVVEEFEAKQKAWQFRQNGFCWPFSLRCDAKIQDSTIFGAKSS